MRPRITKTLLYLSIILAAGLYLGLQSCRAGSSRSTSSKQVRSVSPRTRSANNTIFRGNSATMPKQSAYYRALKVDLCPSPREFRGVWIATVMNIDWPVSATDPYGKQQEDFIRLLDYYRSLNFNAVIVQIRTAGDAFYPSKYSPWSKFLTGKEGRRPATNEDPLAWMILEAHKRGMEFHAWLNPYRATVDVKTRSLSPQHDFCKFPKWMVKYDGRYYYNPGLPEVRAHLVNVIREVVQNYDIDAIHFDDYFYPFKYKAVFNDAATYKKYAKPGQPLDDWRRENINRLICEVSRTIKQEKPWVQFGISPFGVWRNIANDPNGSNTKAGQTNFDNLYADILTWMKNGWIDYLIPQIYWSINHNKASYRELVRWWSRNSFNTKIYIGNGPYKIRNNEDQAWYDPMEIPKQLTLSRSIPNICGNAYFSARSMYAANTDVAGLLRQHYYHCPALTPEIFDVPANHYRTVTPSLVRHGKGFAFQFSQVLQPDFRFALICTAASLQDLQMRTASASFEKVYLDTSNRMLLPIQQTGSSKYIALSFLGRYGNETNPLVFEMTGSL
ncbi:MAG: hypothetical protein ACD_39C01966G0003 [uncultured bacterium]|nr:MAG: hypothetical protein ACD_39C01966G0003 [uncultured bacterium]